MIVVPVIGSAFLGQLLKVVFHSIQHRSWRISSFFDFESFPCMHPLMGGCLTYQLAEATGWSSHYTAIALGFTGVVIYDTYGVKRAAAKQAMILMRIGRKRNVENTLTDLLGQSPARTWIAVFAGVLLGILVERMIISLLGGP
ncbi:MAG: divergent PAP2 family protein [bacterium]|nr:divergent PAP2 family protein [bacterium]